MSDTATTPTPTPAPRREFGRRRVRTLLIAAGVLFGLLLLLGIVPRVLSRLELGAAVEAAANAAPRVPTATPHLAEAIELELPATALAFQQTTIYGRVSGYLQKRLVDIGDRVKAGQLLAVIDAPDLDQQVAQARGALAQAKANLVQQQASLDYARVSLRRYEEANHDGAVAQIDLDERRTAVATGVALVAAAQAAVAAAAASVGQLEQLQDFERVVAPFDGVITERNVDAGALITPGSTSTATTPLFTIAQDDVLRIYVNVPQPFVDRLAVGQTAKLSTRSVPGHVFEGTIARTADALDPNTRTMVVEVDIPNGERLLKPGMYLQVKLVGERVGKRWRIPSSALVLDAKGMQVVVVDPKEHTIKYTPVVLGYDYGSEVEVHSGLQGDEILVTSPSAALTDGQVVEPVERK